MKKQKSNFDSQTITFTIGAGFLMLILNPNSDMVHIFLSCIIGFLLDRYFKVKQNIKRIGERRQRDE